LIDARTLCPFDYDTVLASVKKTGRVDRGLTGVPNRQLHRRSRVADSGVRVRLPRRAGGSCRGARRHLAQAYVLEQTYLPNVGNIVAAAKKLVKG